MRLHLEGQEVVNHNTLVGHYDHRFKVTHTHTTDPLSSNPPLPYHQEFWRKKPTFVNREKYQREEAIYHSKAKNKDATGGDGRAHTQREKEQLEKYSKPDTPRTSYTHPKASGK